MFAQGHKDPVTDVHCQDSTPVCLPPSHTQLSHSIYENVKVLIPLEVVLKVTGELSKQVGSNLTFTTSA